ncbi:MAG: hypothetical protein U1E76_15865 [Planctomycetota bacterium]
MTKLALTSFAAAAALLLGATDAFAGARNPGSLLVFPIFDSQTGDATVITVTNTNSDFSFDPSTNLAKGTVDIEYRYIDGITCREFNRTERLTPTDTLSVIARAHNPEQKIGYVYVYAKHTQSRVPITFNWLIGHELVIDGIYVFDYGVNPWVFNGVPAEGSPTDLDGDNIRDLNGAEYEMAPAELLFPRFFGQSNFNGGFVSDLVLINLTGGASFLATVDFLIYNDNEFQFSAEKSFQCWCKLPLLSISGSFSNDFLASSNDDPDELVGLPAIELGWFRVNGGVASSSVVTLDDPAVLGVLVETIGPFGSASLPYETGTQNNGDLLPRNVQGDQS